MAESESVLLIAFEIADLHGTNDPHVIQPALCRQLPRGGTVLEAGVTLDSWWIADDQRTDNNDCNSAVFIDSQHGITQDRGYTLLAHHEALIAAARAAFDAGVVPEGLMGDLTVALAEIDQHPVVDPEVDYPFKRIG